MTDSNQNMQQSDEITLKELILLIKDYWGILWAKKVYIIAAGLLGALIFGIIEMRNPTTYTANLTFMINESDGSSSGALGGLAASFGLGSVGKGEYNLEKMISLLKTRNLIQQGLFENIEINGKNDFIANHLIEKYSFHENWKDSKDSDLVGFYFKSDSIESFGRTEYSVLKSIQTKVIGSDKSEALLASEINDDTGIVTIKTKTVDESLSIHLVDTLFEKLSKFYVDKTIEKQKLTYEISKFKADSLKAKLDYLQSKLLNINDSRKSLALSRFDAEKLKIERDYQTSLIAYGEAVKNTEIADFILKSKTPFIQAIDRPIPPLKPNKTLITILNKVIIGGIVGGFLAALGLIVSRIYSSVMNDVQ